MVDMKCNCGRDGRYSHFIDGEEVYSCNKYIVCPTYEELEKEVSELRSRNSKMEYNIQKLVQASQILKDCTQINKWDQFDDLFDV